jgi:hypothetical protein
MDYDVKNDPLMKELLAHGLVEQNGSHWRCTKKGTEWSKFLDFIMMAYETPRIPSGIPSELSKGLARAMTHYAADMAENSMGSINAAALLEAIAGELRKNNVPALEDSPSAATH